MAVVGAGVAGLAAAADLAAAGVTVELLEASEVPGGKLRTVELAGVYLDIGAETFLARVPEGVELVRAAGCAAQLVHPRVSGSAIYSRGRLRELPAGTVMGVPGRWGPLARSGVLSPLGVLRAAGDLFRPPGDLFRPPGDLFRPPGELFRSPGELLRPPGDLLRSAGDPPRSGDPGAADPAVGAVVRRHLGREVVDRLVDPLLGGVYAGRAEELSWRATLPQLAEVPATGGSLTRAARAAAPPPGATPAKPVFATVTGGLGTMAVTLADVLTRHPGGRAGGSVRLHLGTAVTALHPGPAGWVLEVVGPPGPSDPVGPSGAPGLPAEGHTVRGHLVVDGVVLAVPGGVARTLLAPSAPAATAALGGLEYSAVAIVTFAWPAMGVPEELRGTGFLVPAVERRTIKAATWLSRKWAHLAQAAPGLSFVRASVGRAGETRELLRDDAELAGVVAAELTALAGLRARPVAVRVDRWSEALPQYRPGHLERVARARRALAGLPGLALAGAAYDGVGIPACVRSGRAAAAQVLGGLDPERLARGWRATMQR